MSYEIATGSKVALANVNWRASEKTLLLVLSNDCRYCAESAPFYQRLVREVGSRGRVRLIAVLPQDPAQAKKYLRRMKVPLTEVRNACFRELDVYGTPTLILVDRQGLVTRSWVGKLPAEMEADVLQHLRA